MSKEIKFDRDWFGTLNINERVDFLIKQKFTCEIEIIDLQPVSKVYVAGVGTPIIGKGNESEDSMISRAKEWLESLRKD